MVLTQRAQVDWGQLGCGEVGTGHTFEQQRYASNLLAELVRIGINAGILESIPECDARFLTLRVNLTAAIGGTATVPVAVSDKLFDAPMTPRERLVLQLIGQGLSNKKIARDLNIAPETVKSHTKHIFCKLGTNTRAQAVACAAKFGLL